MAQRAINMHTSQISHGIVLAADFVNDGDNVVVTGYTPSIVRVYLLDASLDPVLGLHWFSTMPDNQFTGAAMVDSCITVNESGFVLDGAAAVVLSGTTAAFIWETVGCENDGTYRINMNPGAVAADGAMDFIQPVVDPDAGQDEGESGSGESL